MSEMPRIFLSIILGTLLHPPDTVKNLAMWFDAYFFVLRTHSDRVASRMRFPRDHTLIRLQTRIFFESAVTKLYENA